MNIKNIYPFFINKSVIPIGDLILGTHISRNYCFLLESEDWNRDKLDSYRDKMFMKMLYFSYQHVPYYREVFNRRNLSLRQFKGIKDIHKLPILDKKTVKENFDKFLPDNYDSNNRRLDTTGGSTGVPMKYYVSKDAYSWSKAALYRMYHRANYKVGQKLVTLAGSSLSSRTNMDFKKAFFYNVVERSKKISSFNLNEKRMHEYYNLINDYCPSALRGYANALYEFARFIEMKKLAPPKIENIFSASEKLELHKRELIERVFNVKLYDGYGAGDGTIFAHECEKHTGFHIDEEITVTEVIDEFGNVLESGNGELISTSLVNYAFPFIRYKVGDVAEISNEICSCGRSSRLIKKIMGRNHEFIMLKNGTKIHGEFFSHAVRDIVPDIGQFSVHQVKNTDVIIRIVPSQSSVTSISNLKTIIRKKLEGLEVNFIFVDYLESNIKSGKWNFITSEVKT